MRPYKAIMFDLDNTLVDRDKAVGNMMSLILDKCYAGDSDKDKSQMTNKLVEMLNTFKKLDNNGYSNKTSVINTFFNEYPPTYRIPDGEINTFWNFNFPNCFTTEPEVNQVVECIHKRFKTAIITNGATEVQRAKIKNAGLADFFDTVIISDEVGLRKPDRRIFKLALERLGVSNNEAIFIGDNILDDIGGAQDTGIKAVWFNPNRLNNISDVKPDEEITSLNEILSLA